MQSIEEFKGEYEFLSNFYPCRIVYGDIEFKCSEALYMSFKSGDPADLRRFAELDAREAKKLGRKVTLRPDWDEVKLGVMKSVLEMKFEQNPDLKQKLIDTKDAKLVEKNFWKDVYWGVCDGVGENKLGKLLMKLRQKYQSETK